MRWKYKEEFVDTNPKTNVVIAAHTTGQEQFKLFSYLENLGQRALTCWHEFGRFFFQQSTGNLSQTWRFFGWSDRWGSWKFNNDIYYRGNYGYQLKYPDEDCNFTHLKKVRGITLNWKNLMNVNFDVFATQRQNSVLFVLKDHKITGDRNRFKVNCHDRQKVIKWYLN